MEVFHQVHFGIIFSLLLKQTGIVGVLGVAGARGVGRYCSQSDCDSLLIEIRVWGSL